jgi:hypothetical protein
MTVNTLGNPIDRSSRSVAEWLWPFLLGCVSVFCISALVYYHVRWDVVEPRSALQVAIAAVYRWFGLAPSVLFFLLVGTWSSIWLVAGSLDRLGVRLLRLVAMAVMLGVFLNLGDGVGVQQERTEHGALCLEVLRHAPPIERLLEVHHGQSIREGCLPTGGAAARRQSLGILWSVLESPGRIGLHASIHGRATTPDHGAETCDEPLTPGAAGRAHDRRRA